MIPLTRKLLLPAFLLCAWLLLHNSLAPADILFGLILALFLTWLVQWLRPLRAWPKRPAIAARLIWHVFLDIVKSNYQVGKLVFTWSRSKATPGFLKIPLKMTAPHALAGLACIITYTPGTVWADYSQEENILTLHVLDLKDEEGWRQTVQNRYEKPLMEIFE